MLKHIFSGSAKNGYRVLNYWNVTFNGPFVNSEYYVGWLDIWGQKHAHVSAQSAAATLDEALKMRANVNMYMFHGGTNFGFTSGTLCSLSKIANYLHTSLLVLQWSIDHRLTIPYKSMFLSKS